MKRSSCTDHPWVKWGVLSALALSVICLRLRHLGYTEMWADQSQEIGGALNWLNGGPLPLVAMKSSYGVFNPPLIRYLYAVPLWLSRNVLSVVWFTALLNLAAVGITGLAVYRIFGARVAVWATLLYAVNPWSVYYGRLIWMQTVVPFFAGVLFACTLLYFAERPRALYVITGTVALAGAIQTHLTSAVLIGVLGLLAVLLPHRWRFTLFAASALLFVVTFVPYLIFQIRGHWVDLSALQASLSRSSQTNLASLLVAFDLLQSKGMYSTAGSAAGLWRALDPIGGWVDDLVAAALVVAVVAASWSVVSGMRRASARQEWSPQVRGRLVLLVWLLVPILAFLRHTHYLQNYYFLYWPFVQCALLSLSSEQARRWLQKSGGPLWARAVVFLPLALIVLQQGWTSVIGQNLLAEGASGQQRVLDVHRAVDGARRLVEERPACQLVVVSEGHDNDSSRFGLLREFLAPRPVRFMSAGESYLVPAPCAVYFSATDDPPAQAWLLANASLLSEATIRTPEQTWTFHDLPAEERAALAARWGNESDAVAAWQNGVSLLNVEAPAEVRPGQTLPLTSTWSVTSHERPAAIHYGNYLLSADDQLVAQVDGPGVDGIAWQPGDVFQLRFGLPVPPEVPPGDYRLAVGLYLYPEITNVPLQFPEGDLAVVGEVRVSTP